MGEKLVSFMLLCVALSNASPLKRHKAGSGVKLYSISALEKGIIGRDDVQVNEEEDYEILRVPAHNGLDAVDILFSFKENLTLLRFPEKGSCLVSTLGTTQFTKPSLLAKSLDHNKALWMDVPQTTQNHIISDIPTGFHLPPALADFCRNESVFLATEEVGVQQVQKKEDLFIQPITPVQTHFREKRQFFMVDSCPRSSQGRACLINVKFHHFTFDYIHICRSVRRESTQGRRIVEETLRCDLPSGAAGQARCCITCCTNADEADEHTPYCANITTKNMQCPFSS